MRNQKDKVLLTIKEPEFIQKGDYGEKLAVRLFDETPLTQKYLVVIYKEEDDKDGFIITAYFTRQTAQWREIVWKR